MRTILRSFVIILVMSGIAMQGFAQDQGGDARIIRPNRRISSFVPLSESGRGYTSFVLTVDDNDFALEVALSDADADLDIYLRHGGPIEDYSRVDAFAATGAYNESLFLSRLSRKPLSTGIYYIDVVYQGEYAPLREYHRLKTVPFEIEVRTISEGSRRPIRIGSPVSAEILPGDGMAKTFSLELPSGVKECRVDLFDADANLDILVGYEKPALNRQTADYIGDKLIGNESLVFGTNSRMRNLPAGTYYITVYDPVQSLYPASFGILVSMGTDVPDSLTRIPPFPLTDDELQHSLLATVEVIGERGRGSGCIVSDDGLVLTNWHVIRGFSGEASADIYVAASFSPSSPPQELFKARVVELDREDDLALLEINSGMHGQELPYDYTFPWMALGESHTLSIGQPLRLIGYPGVGAAGSRVSVSLSRGIISGFERRGNIEMIRTDSTVLPGSSGGAVINPYFELVGITRYSVGEMGGGFGYVFPVSDLPETWLERIRSRSNF